MKKLIAAIALIVGSLGTAQAQSKVVKPMLSAFTKRYLVESRKKNAQTDHLPNYVYKRINNKTYLSALIKVNSDINQGQLDALGVFIGTRAGSIWTAQVPVENVAAFTNTPGISYISLDVPIYPFMDSARKETHADSAQKGINLPATVTGRGVVVGIIDAGFDFNHPTMFDTANNFFRIKKVWTQKIAGTPPTGFSYGNELTDSGMIKAQGYDTSVLSHGTHVAGTAAGSGYTGNSANGRFRGMAYESDIVLVGIMPDPQQWIVSGESDIIDGLNYIFTYAASIGEPAVANLSWGSTLGPHDGSSLFGQACDALTGPGKIFVCAAGNNGEDTVHLGKTFTAIDTTFSTFVTFSPYLDSNHQYTWVDVWGDSGKVFCLNVKLYDSSSAIDSTGFICLPDTMITYNLIGSNGDTSFVTVISTPADQNGKPHAFIELHSKVHDNICLTTRATEGLVNMWEGYVLPPTGYYGYLKSLGYPWAVSGDAKMTVSDIGCTKTAITAGAYSSKVSFTNISGSPLYYPGGVHGKIAPFSSFGPASDGRVKPDITAPGFALASSVNSYDPTYNPAGSNYSSVIKADTNTVSGRIYRYAMLAGTSMASPCVAGIVGMMLQINPTLSPDDAKTIINATAITDSYTGTLPAAGTNTWGHGKINAYAAVSYLVQKESVKSLNMSPMDCILYPNPGKGRFTVEYTSKAKEQLSVDITDMAGKLMSKESWNVTKGGNIKQFNSVTLPKGIYLVKISSSMGYNVIKLSVE
jgi:minor extracellular serine protease Vpr